MAMTSAKALWDALQKHFERLKYTIKPLAEQEWVRLCFCDYKHAREYNFALHRICTLLCLCGKEIIEEEKIEKTLSTFHPNTTESARNHHQSNYKKYSELIDVLQFHEVHNKVIKKNFLSQS